MLLLLPSAVAGRCIDLIDPIVLFAVYVVIGTTLGGAFLSYGEGYRRSYLMAGEQLEFFVTGAFWIALALLFVGVSHLISGRDHRASAAPTLSGASKVPSWSRLLPVALVLLFISATATISFVIQTGGFSWADLSTISRKRTIHLQLEGGGVAYGAAGYLRLAASIAFPLALLMIAWATQLRPDRARPYFALAALLAISSLALPFVSSSRSDVVIPLLQILAVWFTFGRLRPSRLLAVAIIGATVFGGMTALRTFAQGSELEQRAAISVNPITALGASGNGLSLVGTSLVVQRVPERMDYMLGSSYLTWIYAPIPRALWPTKPDVSLGKVVKERVLGLKTIASGRPPGFLGEGYMNFGAAGFFLSALLLGLLFRKVADFAAPHLGISVGWTVLYILVFPEVAALANANTSQVIVRVATIVSTFIIVHWIATGCLSLSASRTTYRPDRRGANLSRV